MKKVIPANSVLLPEAAKCVFEGEIFDVYQWPQQMYDGSSATFEMLKRPDTVSVIGVTDNKILVIDDEQPHSGLRKSFPGGRVDPVDDSIVAAAQREVREETGYSFNNWRLIKVWQPYRKMEWFVHVLLAWDVVDKQSPTPDAGEKITVAKVSFEELRALIMGRVGYLGESEELLHRVANIDELLCIPEYLGQIVER